MTEHSQLDRLRDMAKRFQAYFRNPGLAETSFITSARFRGFSHGSVHRVAALFWPKGHVARLAAEGIIDL
ncbi:MAG TPA: hypothetical protein PLG59_10420 [bacterium]|nr:hypothetical protein [bacterium]HQO35068.1 hypothetical protein [bacterium]HQP98902.1 hypothetical protein [bacterium]